MTLVMTMYVVDGVEGRWGGGWEPREGLNQVGSTTRYVAAGDERLG